MAPGDHFLCPLIHRKIIRFMDLCHRPCCCIVVKMGRQVLRLHDNVPFARWHINKDRQPENFTKKTPKHYEIVSHVPFTVNFSANILLAHCA